MSGFYVYLHDDPHKTERLIDLFVSTEKFLSERFKKNEKDILQAKGSVLGDNYEVQTELEIFRLPNGSAVYINEAAAFIQRYIMKKGNKNYVASYEFDPPEPKENEPCRAKLTLTGVTPLNDEVVGAVYPTKKDAFKSGKLLEFFGLTAT